MQSNRQQINNRSWKNILFAITFSVFSCIIGIVIGISGLWFFQQTKPSVYESVLSKIESPTSIITSSNNMPSEDGFFIVQNGSYVKIPEIYDDNELDFSILPEINDKKPYFAIRGANYPLGNLKLKSYIAGIGVSVSFTQTGAVINHVFDNSPAQMANLQKGEVIISIDDNPVKQPMIYTPGKNDLLGEMREKVTLVVLSGTSHRTVEMPRTFRETVGSSNSLITSSSKSFSIEPKEQYVLLYVDREMKPGVYRFEFQADNIQGGGALLIQPTPTPTQPPMPLPTQKWIFVVK